MPATGDPIASAANDTPAPIDNSRLEQPGDAVPMESMPQNSTDPVKPAIETGAEPESDHTKPDAEPTTMATTAAAAAAEPTAAESDSPGDVVSDLASKEPQSESQAAPPSQVNRDRQDSMAIGPAQEEIGSVVPGTLDNGPVCNITLLLTSGSRHPYKIDGKYLNRRNVTVPDETESGHPDPFSISIYTLKELILREWRSDWEAKPASPSSIRLIHFGKLLDDKEPLKKYQFSTESPNVVHLSVRPTDLDEEEVKAGGKNAGSGSGSDGRSRGGGCCVVL